jgi:D-alanyl-D-alanine dipeptidase
MPTKDPHVALIDAQEAIHIIRASIQTALAHVKAKRMRGEPLTEEDKMMTAAIRATAIEATKRVQDTLAEELESHGRLN